MFFVFVEDKSYNVNIKRSILRVRVSIGKEDTLPTLTHLIQKAFDAYDLQSN
jgi:hypothetical protein